MPYLKAPCAFVCARSQRVKADAVYVWQCAFHMKNKQKQKMKLNPPTARGSARAWQPRRWFCSRHTICSPSRPSRRSEEDNAGRQNWKLKSDCRFLLHIPHTPIRLRQHKGGSALSFPFSITHELFSSQIFYKNCTHSAHERNPLHHQTGGSLIWNSYIACIYHERAVGLATSAAVPYVCALMCVRVSLKRKEQHNGN